METIDERSEVSVMLNGILRNAETVLRVFAACTTLLTILPATAQDWPAKPVRFIVPFPAGGTVDLLARLTGAKISESLKQSFVVENRPGGSGSIGAALAAKSPPDGYTFLFVFDTHAVIPSLIPNLPYDTTKDLAAVMLVATGQMGIATHPSRPYQSFNDLIKAAKEKPESLTYGTIGNGSLGHLTMVLVQQAAGIKLVHIPYKGGPPMTQDVIGNQIDIGIGSLAIMTPHAKAGTLRVIAVTGEKRTHALPEVRSLAEQGLAGFSAHAWWGVFTPAGTPKPIISRFHGELVKVLGAPEIRNKLTDLGMDLRMSTPGELQSFLEGEIQRWGKVVKDNNIRLD